MSLFLRKIRRSRWHRGDLVPWLAEEELQADALLDLKTEDSRLSVWVVEDDRSNLRKILAAMAAGSDNLSNLDYALFDSGLVEGIAATTSLAPGNTPDRQANEEWHRDIVELTVAKIQKLARIIGFSAKKERAGCKEVAEAIAEAVKEGRINLESLKESIKKKVSKVLPQG